MIIASIYVTGGAILIGVPIALFTSVFMARYCPQKIYRPLKSGIELMAGVPSIVYGFFGLVLMVPLIRSTFRRNRNELAGSFTSSGDCDSSDDHRTYRICTQKCTGKLL